MRFWTVGALAALAADAGPVGQAAFAAWEGADLQAACSLVRAAVPVAVRLLHPDMVPAARVVWPLVVNELHLIDVDRRDVDEASSWGGPLDTLAALDIALARQIDTLDALVTADPDFAADGLPVLNLRP